MKTRLISVEKRNFASAMRQKLNDYYGGRVESLTADIVALKRRNRYFVLAEIATFGGMLTFLVLLAQGWGHWMLAVAMLACYLLVRRMDVRNSERIKRKEHLCKVYEHELSYLRGDFSCFDAGERYIDAHHPFTFDLDIFGPESLYQRINQTITSGGADYLASCLGSVSDAEGRSEAIRELSAAESWRAQFMALGQDSHVDSQALVDALRNISVMSIPQWLSSRWVLVAALTALVGSYACTVLALTSLLSGKFAFVWGLTLLFLVTGLTARSVRTVSRAVNHLYRQMLVYVNMLRLAESACWQSSVLKRVYRSLFDAQTGNALQSFGQLERIMDSLDRRNEFSVPLFNLLALSDFFVVRHFVQWQLQYMDRLGEWLTALSELDALVSMATFCYNEPEAIEAEVISSPTLVYHAENLRHPFLGTSAVGSDFSVSPQSFYIITGANMAGKSTFLRSVGINYVLAMQGMPVFADRLQVSRFGLFSSMRTSDDLSHGISYFNAELLRLQQLIRHCTEAKTPTLIILDEILKGTNSLDKLNGSRLFLKEISRLDVSGIVATHDLELSKMENGRFYNYCFEIELDSEVTYTYKLTPGVARNQNATFLLQQIIKEIG